MQFKTVKESTQELVQVETLNKWDCKSDLTLGYIITKSQWSGRNNYIYYSQISMHVMFNSHNSLQFFQWLATLQSSGHSYGSSSSQMEAAVGIMTLELGPH